MNKLCRRWFLKSGINSVGRGPGGRAGMVGGSSPSSRTKFILMSDQEFIEWAKSIVVGFDTSRGAIDIPETESIFSKKRIARFRSGLAYTPEIGNFFVWRFDGIVDGSKLLEKKSDNDIDFYALGLAEREKMLQGK